MGDAVAKRPNTLLNLAEVVESEGIRSQLTDELQAWLEKSGDPLLQGPVPAASGNSSGGWKHA